MGEKTKWQEIKDYFRFWPFQGWEWRIRNFVNIIDDPVDNVKHKLHGLSIFGLKFYLPPWLMRGQGKKSREDA